MNYMIFYMIYFKIVINAIYILTDLNQSKKVFFDNKKDIETVMFQNLMTEQEYIQKYYHILKYLKNEN